MRHFAQLFLQLDQTTKTNSKVAALAQYFSEVEDSDKLWTIALLSHRRPKRTVNTTLLRQWAAELSGIPLWLFEDSYHIVGDLAETIALVLPEPAAKSDATLTYWIEYIQELKDVEEAEKQQRIFLAWQMLSPSERFIFNKLITGGFRVGVSQKLMTRALSKYTGIEENTLAHRLMGDWTPESTSFSDLILEDNPKDNLSKPYPFYLAYPLEGEPETLGSPQAWQVERKWDGIRGQLIVREGEIFVWSRGEELMTDKFPEYHILRNLLPNGTVIDGEILPFKAGKPLPFKLLQTRIGRKNLTKNVLDKAPVILMAYDLLEYEGEDIRGRSLEERRELLEQIVKNSRAKQLLKLSETLEFDAWEELIPERDASRAHFSEGLMLKRKSASYQVGRKKGDWWKWKIDPLLIDAVMIYAQQGHGRRANLFTDYTFAVWKGEELVPFTKAYSGLTDAEIRELDAWIKRNTIERFGPVRSVVPEKVFEIAFEGINESTRHKSGVALRFPRINRWRKDKPKEEANTLDELHALLKQYETS
ncbi:MAG: ATP-dependent DNA ligase [Bacteroidota bacterium]